MKRQRLPGFYLVCALGLVYAVFMGFFVDYSYLSYKEGSLFYWAWRRAAGDSLVRQVGLSYSPLTSFLTFFGVKFFSPVLAFRVLMVLIRVLCAYLVYKMAWNLTRSGKAAVLSFIVFLILPVGFASSRIFLAEGFVLLVYLLLLNKCLEDENAGVSAAALLSAVGLLLDVSFIPFFAVFTVWFLSRQKAGEFLKTTALIFVPAYLILRFVFLRVPFNLTEMLAPVFHKVSFSDLSQPLSFLTKREGEILILFAIVGALFFFMKPSKDKGFIFLQFLGACYLIFCSSAFLVRSSDFYAFVLLEPLLAFFFVYFFLSMRRMSFGSDWLVKGGLVALMLIALFFPAYWDLLPLYRNNEQRVFFIERVIRKKSLPRDVVLAPPYLAYVSKRRLDSDFAKLLYAPFSLESGKKQDLIGRVSTKLKDRTYKSVVSDKTLRETGLNDLMINNYKRLAGHGLWFFWYGESVWVGVPFLS